MTQTVIKIGNSLGVTIPKEKINELKLVAGDKVDFSIVRRTSKALQHDQLLKDLGKFMDTYDQDLKNLAKR